MIRKLTCLLACAVVGFFAGCSKSSSGPSSAEGKWAYTTPDGKIAVTFDLVKTSSGSVDLQNPTIKVNGTSGNAAALIQNVNLPTIGSIRISANDAALVYPHSVTFTNGTVSGDFKTINVPTGEYVYYASSSPTTTPLTAVVIVRP